MNEKEIDQILYTRLIIARKGEKELKNWWNTAIAFEICGDDFLRWLIGEKSAPFSTGEAILKAAFIKEQTILSQIPDGSYFRLFCPNPHVDIALKDRLRYFKRYPYDIHDEKLSILNPVKEWNSLDLGNLSVKLKEPSFQSTSFGKLIDTDANCNELTPLKPDNRSITW